MFGDNCLVVYSAMTLCAKVCKRHIALSLCCLREAIADDFVIYYFISGKINVAGILSKH